MKLLLLRFIDICLLRSGPQDIPASTALMALSVFAYCTVGLFSYLVGTSLTNALLLVGVDIILLAGLVFVILWVRMLTTRYVQTLTALTGTGAMLAIISWPVLYWLQSTTAQPDAGLSLTSPILWIWWIWVLWNLAVVGHIIRYALSTTFFFGALLSLLYLFISYGVNRVLFYSSAT